MVSGKSVEKLSRDVAKSFGSSAFESRRLLTTEVARCQTQAFNDIYKDSDIVKKVMWSATLENNTCVNGKIKCTKFRQ